MSALISLMCPCRIKVFINKYKNNTETLWQVQIVHLPKPARFYNSAHLWIKRLNGGDLHVVSDICWKEAHPKISQFLLSLTRIHSIWEMIIFIRRLPSERVLPCHKISQITLCCSCWDAVMTAGDHCIIEIYSQGSAYISIISRVSNYHCVSFFHRTCLVLAEEVRFEISASLLFF